jgi:formiminoglutamate deiminase
VTPYWCERAWLGPDRGISDGVTVRVEGTRIAAVDVGQPAPEDATRLAGLTIPGLANCHSHAFHRALRGRTQRGTGSFWTWRDQMYAAAERLDPDRYHRLARATYAEMALAGITCVGEFHYLHHDRDGRPYSDANAFGEALVAAAREVGIRIALLDTCYLAAGFDRAPEGVQRRFSDGDAHRWADRVEALAAAHAESDDVVVGAAIHSVRAVPAGQIGVVADWARRHRAPLHVHLSEQPAENTDCLAAHGLTPTALLDEHGALGPMTSAVHATHLTGDDIGRLGSAQAYACFCPTTERDLADGIGPSAALREAGVTLTLGSDSHAVIDPFEEMRAVELNERLATQRRGTWSAGALLAAATVDGHRSLGFGGFDSGGDSGRDHDTGGSHIAKHAGVSRNMRTPSGRASSGRAGVIEPGARADLVAVATDSTRTAGTGGDVEGIVFAASAVDVTDVVSGGDRIVSAGRHHAIPDVAGELAAAIDELMEDR